MSKVEPLFLKPVFQEKIWGGTRLQTDFGYDLPNDKIGECWAISAHPNGESIIENGEYAGIGLAELWTNHRALFGNEEGAVFPLLTKILDAEDDLSVQVHPDDTYGLAHEGELGKTECWYVISADEDAEIVYGHHAKNKAELSDWIDNGEWDKLLRRVKVKAGEFYYVPSGTVHAIGKGITILETQQNSDTTYRLYDYDRVDEAGHKRELHLQQSKDVIRVPHEDPVLNITTVEKNGCMIKTFVETDFFNVYEWRVTEKAHIVQKNNYTLVSVLAGEGVLTVAQEDYPIKKGMHFILPKEVLVFDVVGDLQMIASTSGK